MFEGIKNAGLDVQPYLYLEHANIAFFSFRMPLFFIIAGIFVSRSLEKRGLKEFVLSKVKTILYVYLIWTVLQISMQIGLSNYVNASRGWMDFLYILYAPRYLDQFWYLHTLFFVLIIYGAVKYWLSPHYLLHIGVGMGMFFLSAYFYRSGAQLYFLNDILHHYVFMAVGDAVSKYFFKKETFSNLGRIRWLLIMLPVFIAAQYYFLKVNISHIDTDKGYQYVEFFQPFIYLVIALSGCFFVILFCFLLQNWNWFIWLRDFGQYSLYIYASHVFATSFIRIVLVKGLHIENIPVILVSGIIAGAVLPVLFYKISPRIGLRWLFVWPEKKKMKLVTI